MNGSFSTANKSLSCKRILLGALFSFLSAGVSSQGFAADLKIVMESRLGNLDPIVSASHQVRDHGYLIYDTLFALDAEQKIQPQMVDSYSVSPGNDVYIFKLRTGLNWHDGKPVTSKDVVASIQRWSKRDRMGGVLMSIVKDISAPDETTFTLALKEPSGIVLEAFAKTSGIPLFIMPERVAQTPATEAIKDYTGSGPFIFKAEEYQPGVKVVYTKNTAYIPRNEKPSWLAGGKVTKVDRIERIEMPDAMTALNALNSGEVDYVQSIPPDLLPLVDASTVDTLVVDKVGNQSGYRLNHLQAPFNNKLARQAALLAVGQKEVMQAQFGGAGNYSLCGAIFGCGLPYESDVGVDAIVKADPEKAKALLQTSGYKGEPVMIMQVSDVPAISAIAPVMAQQLRAAGFTVQLQSMDFMSMLSRRANQGPVDAGGWSIFVTSWHNSEIQDPLRNYMIEASGKTGYAGWGDVPAIAKLTRDFLTAPGQAQRKAIAADIQKVVYDEGIYAPLGSWGRIAGTRKTITGLMEAPANVFWNIQKEGK